MSSELNAWFRQLHLVSAQTPGAHFDTAFARDVLDGLRGNKKRLSSMYFYDDLGSSLFEAICKLPEYGCARGEKRLLHRHRWEIANLRGGADFIIELGGGCGEKAAILAPALLANSKTLEFHNVDISKAALELSQSNLSKVGAVVTSHQNSFVDGLKAALAARRQSQHCLVLFLGSTISNFEPDDADAFFLEVRSLLQPGDALLLGTDLIKPRKTLLAAYDDPLGVTAAFNKNLLARINRELQGNFDLAKFSHQAIWNDQSNRIEMHLCSEHDQSFSVANETITFQMFETIWTENSYKYSPEQVHRWSALSGFYCSRQWVDRDALFACNYLLAV